MHLTGEARFAQPLLFDKLETLEVDLPVAAAHVRQAELGSREAAELVARVDHGVVGAVVEQADGAPCRAILIRE